MYYNPVNEVKVFKNSMSPDNPLNDKSLPLDCDILQMFQGLY
jgi:hypothetical protein